MGSEESGFQMDAYYGTVFYIGPIGFGCFHRVSQGVFPKERSTYYLLAMGMRSDIVQTAMLPQTFLQLAEDGGCTKARRVGHIVAFYSGRLTHMVLDPGPILICLGLEPSDKPIRQKLLVCEIYCSYCFFLIVQ